MSRIDKPKIVIVDDEPLARLLLRSMLAKQQYFQLVAECATGAEAIYTIEQEKPAVVILDIRLPDMMGFDIVGKLRHLPHIIFSTAYDAYAVQAFAINAVDYLLKPYDQKRLALALKRAYDRIRVGRKQDLKRIGKAFTSYHFIRLSEDRLVVREKGQLHNLKFNDIVWIKALDDYLCIYLVKSKLVIKERLKNIEAQLDPSIFVRIHRSAIVNRNSINSIQFHFDEEPRIVLHGGIELRVSRRRLPLIKALLLNKKG